jgi:hypothetical protein
MEKVEIDLFDGEESDLFGEEEEDLFPTFNPPTKNQKQGEINEQQEEEQQER